MQTLTCGQEIAYNLGKRNGESHRPTTGFYFYVHTRKRGTDETDGNGRGGIDIPSRYSMFEEVAKYFMERKESRKS